jgi:hypothetical protein
MEDDRLTQWRSPSHIPSAVDTTVIKKPKISKEVLLNIIKKLRLDKGKTLLFLHFVAVFMFWNFDVQQCQ